MKRLYSFLIIIAVVFSICGCRGDEPAEIAATTLPVYDFTSQLCQNTGLRVKRIISEEVSCLHDYTLQVDQTKALESSELIVMSGAGLESFLPEYDPAKIVDASAGITLHCNESSGDHSHGHNPTDGHAHDKDPHIWLSVPNAQKMCENIYNALVSKYPEHRDRFTTNYASLQQRFADLEKYASEQLSHITHSELITFHDGFHYLAESWDLHIIRAIEEESGSEASAAELKELITIVREHELPAIFTERSGSTSAAEIVAKETGVPVYSLDMAMSGDSYFDAMYDNIDTLKEALE